MKGKQKVITLGRERGMVLVKRKVIKVGTSVGVILPAEFVREQNIKPGLESHHSGIESSSCGLIDLFWAS